MNKRSIIAFLLLATVTAGTASAQWPNPPVPPENPITEAKRVLGKILFWEEQLGSDNTVSCGTCHISAAGGSDPRSSDPNSLHPGFDGAFSTGDEAHGSRGVMRCSSDGTLLNDGTFFPDLQVTGRKTPSMINAAFAPDIFWDGRAKSQFIDPDTGLVAIVAGGGLESQAVGPPLSDVEMACELRNFPQVHAKLGLVTPMRLATNIPADMAAAITANPTYPALFNAAFGSTTINTKRIAFAIATYERTLISDQTPLDVFLGGAAVNDPGSLTTQQAAGLTVFENTGNCALCHAMPETTDNSFRVTGLVDPSIDIGQQATTGLLADRGKFKVPNLRNTGLREAGGLFHLGTGNGSSVDAVVSFYTGGGVFLDNIDPDMMVLNLSAQEEIDLIEFVRNGLTDPRVAAETFPFDRPTLYSERQGDGTLATSNPKLIGVGTAGAGGIIPKMLAQQPPSLQAFHYTVGVANTMGGAFSLLAFGFQAAPGETYLGAVPLSVAQSPFPMVVPRVTSGVFPNAGEGHTSVSFAIPNNPGIVGFTLYAQWFVVDFFGPFSVAASEGIEVTIMP